MFIPSYAVCRRPIGSARGQSEQYISGTTSNKLSIDWVYLEIGLEMEAAQRHQ